MEIVRHPEIEKDLKKLKKFAAPVESLESWERFFVFKGLAETPAIDQMPGFGNKKIYKARVVLLKENISKSHGYRLIFQVLDTDKFEILVFSRHGVYHDENDLIILIKNRILNTNPNH